MGVTRVRDIASILGKTQAANPTNSALSSGGELDSAAVLNLTDDFAGRNMIINGNFAVMQRDSSATGITTTGYYTADRWKTVVSNDATLSQQLYPSVPSAVTNFNNRSFRTTVTTADTSIGADQYAHIQQRIEAQHCDRMNWGDSDAKPITASFWVRSRLPGTYCLCVSKPNASTNRYDHISEYTISDSDTWEYKTITITPNHDIAGGGILNGSLGIGGRIYNGTAQHSGTGRGDGLALKWVLAAGSNRHGSAGWNSSTPADATSNQVNWLKSTQHFFELFNVQLEVGDTATPFEYKPYKTTMDECLRYYYRFRKTVAYGTFISPVRTWSTTNFDGTLYFPVPMRTAPTLSTDKTVNGTNLAYNVNGISLLETDIETSGSVTVAGTVPSGLTAAGTAALQTNGASSAIDFSLIFDAEL